jgi:hypothetical protein
MKFRSTPPDAREVPKAGLLLPPSIPLAIATLAWLADTAGQKWNVHGDAVALLFFFAVSTVCGLIWSGVCLIAVVPALRTHRTLRSRGNLIAVAYAGAFVSAALVLAGYTIWNASNA